jgi:hypothetical protein
MSDGQSKRIRIEQTRQEVDRLCRQVAEWARRRHARDPLGQYRTQLATLQTILTECLKGVRSMVEEIDGAHPTGEVYAACGAADRRLALVGRVFDWFRAKFDQRDDPDLRPVLAAADEVVWSCYAEVFRNAERLAGRTVRPGPAPLAYLEPEYAPRALPRDQPPPELRPDATDPVFRELLTRLPVPVIGVPMGAAEAPWWLVLLGHEVGHHVQNDLVPDWGLVEEFGRLLEAAARDGSAGNDQAATRWRRWAGEVFADICLACSAGPWGVWVVVELELTDDRAMVASNRARYPSPVARLGLLAEVAGTLGLDGRVALREVEPEKLAAGDPTATADLDLTSGLAVAALGHSLGGLGTFGELYAFDPNDYRPGGTVDHWARALRSPALLFPEPTLRAARLIASGGIAAWSEVAALPDLGERAEAREALRDGLLGVLAQSREEDTRAADPSGLPDPIRLGQELARHLIERIPEPSA